MQQKHASDAQVWFLCPCYLTKAEEIMQLYEIIGRQINELGPIPFHDFMEMCLYYPDLGYYTSANDKIGAGGDFYTSTSLGNVFAAILAEQLTEMWQLTGRGNFTIVEYGAGTGALCHDILHYLEGNEEFYDKLQYCIIEKSPAMRSREQAILHQKVRWIDSIDAVQGTTGCVLSNELLDNMAVHRVVMQEKLMEIYVAYDGNRFSEMLLPARRAVQDYLEELNVRLSPGFRTEVNLEALQWIREVAECLGRGYVMTIDYGYPSAELYRDHRRDGTLLCYKQHQINDNPYDDVGQQDITTHVNFSALHHWGQKYGLRSCGYTDQAHFMLALGFKDHLHKMQEPDPERNKVKNSLLINTLLRDMGSKFKVLVQAKGMEQTLLSGLKNVSV